jgi:hypothetical protein
MGVKARCRPCHRGAHRRHMKRQPWLCQHHPHCGHCHCIAVAISVVITNSVTITVAVAHSRRHRPLPLWLPSTITAAVSVPLPSAIAIAIAVALVISHCCLHHHQPSQLPSLLAITVTVAVGHFQKLLPWRSKNCIRPIKAKNAHLILFCLDSGRHTAQSRMTDQVSGSNGQHQHWVESSKQ